MSKYLSTHIADFGHLENLSFEVQPIGPAGGWEPVKRLASPKVKQAALFEHLFDDGIALYKLFVVYEDGSSESFVKVGMESNQLVGEKITIVSLMDMHKVVLP